MKFPQIWLLMKDAGVQFWNDKGPRLGAALAFYTVLSLSPLLIVLLAIAGSVFGEQAARGEIQNQIQDMVGEEGAKIIEGMLAKTHTSGTSTLMTIVGVVTLLIGATGVFAELQSALDTVWEVDPKRASGGIWGAIRDRLLSFSVICGLAFLLLVSLVFSAAFSALDGWIEVSLPLRSWGLQLVNQAVSFLLTAALFAFIFKVLPHTRPAWSDVWIGALITATLFTLGKYLIGLYLGQTAPGSTFGAAGSLIVLLVWIYYSTQILLLGAEFTEVYANRFGSGLSNSIVKKSDPTNFPGSESATGTRVA